MLFKNGDKDIKEMIEKQAADSKSESELSVNLKNPQKKKTLDEANLEL